MHSVQAARSAPADMPSWRVVTTSLPWRWFTLIFMLALVALGGLLWLERQRQYDAETARLLDVTRYVDEVLTRQIAGVNAALIGLRNDYFEQRLAATQDGATRQLQLLTDAMPSVSDLTVFDANGVAVAAARPGSVGRDFFAAENFTAARDAGDPARLHMTRPSRSDLPLGTNGIGGTSGDAHTGTGSARHMAAVTAPAPGTGTETATPAPTSTPPPPPTPTRAMHLSRSIIDGQGAFVGAVSATLDSEFYAAAVRSATFAPDMRATLTHSDGTVFLTVPALSSAPRNLNVATPGSMFERHVQSGRKANVFAGRVQVTGQDRLIAFSNVRPVATGMDQSLVLSVSRDLGAIQAPWLAQLRNYGVLLAGMGLAAAVLRVWAERRRIAADRLEAHARRSIALGAERLERALAGADLGLWELAPHADRLDVDARGLAMLGRAMGDAPTTPAAWTRLLHPDDQAPNTQAFGRVFAGSSTAYEQEFRVRHADGRWLWLLSRGKLAEAGVPAQPPRMIGTFMDITDRKASEEELARLSLMLERSGEMAKVGGWVLDVATGHSSWTAEVFRIHDLDLLEAPALAQAMAFYTPESRAAYSDAVQAGIARGAPWDLELEIVSARGRYKWVRVQGEALRVAGQVVRLAGAIQDITDPKRAAMELQSANTLLSELSVTDALTALGNRRKFDDALAAEWARALRDDSSLCLLMTDVDFFKRYNDRHGHPAGDDVLKQVAQVLRGALHRAHERAVRYGGEEFAVLLPGTDSAGAAVVAQRVLDSMAALALPHGDSLAGPTVSLSLGIACLRPAADKAVTAGMLVEQADAALYRAKSAGRACFRF